jgi:hypothetical protein
MPAVTLRAIVKDAASTVRLSRNGHGDRSDVALSFTTASWPHGERSVSLSQRGRVRLPLADYHWP